MDTIGMVRAILASCVVAFVATGAHAQEVDTAFTYQGELRDNGVPANGSYDFRVELFAQADGGTRRASADVPRVRVIDGIFALSLDFGESIRRAGGQWLQISVAAPGSMDYTTLLPRQQVTPAPRAVAAFGAIDRFDVTNGLDGSPIFQVLPFDNLGGGFQALDEEIRPYAVLRPDADGIGGSMFLTRNGTDPGFMVDGNVLGSQATRMDILGPERFTSFDMSLPGSASVRIPTNAIESLEILDEPGLATVIPESTALSNNDLMVVAQRTITPPANGYVLLLASGIYNARPRTTTYAVAVIGLSDSRNGFASTSRLTIRVPPGGVPDDNLPAPNLPYALHTVYPVTANQPRTFYLLAQGGSSRISSLAFTQMTAVFIPTAYGSVSEPGAVSPRAENRDGASPAGDPLAAAANAADRAERQASVQWDQQRRADELAEIRRLHEELQARIDAFAILDAVEERP